MTIVINMLYLHSLLKTSYSLINWILALKDALDGVSKGLLFDQFIEFQMVIFNFISLFFLVLRLLVLITFINKNFA